MVQIVDPNQTLRPSNYKISLHSLIKVFAVCTNIVYSIKHVSVRLNIFPAVSDASKNRKRNHW